MRHFLDRLCVSFSYVCCPLCYPEQCRPARLVRAREDAQRYVVGREQELRARAVPAEAEAVRAAWYAEPEVVVDSWGLEVPGAAAVVVAAGVTAALGIPAAAVDLVAAGAALMSDSPAAAAGLQQAVGVVEFLNRVHNMCRRSHALNYDRNRGNAWVSSPNCFYIRILLRLVYHNVIWVVFFIAACEPVRSYMPRL